MCVGLAHRTVSAIIHKAYPFGLILIKCPATIELCAYIAYTQRAPLSALIVITSRRQNGEGERKEGIAYVVRFDFSLLAIN